jgi:Divergent InlB B-repeat domain
MSNRLKLLVCVGAVGIASLVCAASAAADFEVNDTGDGSDAAEFGPCEATAGQGDCTLRAAIESADYFPDVLDTITFEAGLGPIVVSSALVVHGNTTIDGNGSSGTGATVIDGNDATNVFASTSFTTDPTLTFRDLRIEDGALTGGNGAGIDTSFDTVIENSVITSNAISGGGTGAAISNTSGDPGSLIIENSQITNNTITTGNATGQAAGIASNSSLSLTDSVVSGNSIDGSGQVGGDDQSEGAGMWINQDLAIEGSTISGNSVSSSGLARGAGIFSAQGPQEITNSTISTNTASGTGSLVGGGVYQNSPALTNAALTNVTFANNAAASGADLAQNSGAATVRNTIFGTPSACMGTIASATPGHNIDSGTSCGLGSTNGNMSSTDPLMQTGLVEFGSGQKVHILLFGSPAIDNADPTCGGLSVDQVGLERPQGTVCDIGAYERNYRDLSVTVDGNGSVAGTGISCGGDCTESYVDGDTVVLTASPATGFQLASWEGCTPAGAQCTVDMGNDRLVTATFSALPPPTGGGGTTTPPPTVPKKCKKGQKLKKGKCVKKKKKRKKRK